jgi:hypothetical protein
MIQRLLSCVALAALVACSGNAQEATSTTAETVRSFADRLSDQNPETPAKLLFVVALEAGTITKVNDTRHELSFSADDLNTALAFTDRPERQAFDLTLPMLLAMWGEGSNSFVADPPNAVVEDSRFRVGVTEVTGLRADGETITFHLDNMAFRSLDASDDLVGEVGHLSLFIDSSIITVAGVAGLLRVAAQGCAEAACYLWPLGG